MTLPNPGPRPAHEIELLRRIWNPPRGLRFLTVINNNYIGVFYIGAAFLFFLLAGILALLMRTQLAVPENNLIGPTLYNQLFTMHGTMMMFLFAVPVVEAIGILLLPNMLGARDLPFPRLSAFAFWAYFVGGLVFFASLFAGWAPAGGWFMNPPLTTETYSPGFNEDFWLLGIGFIEISAIAGAIEIVVGVLRTRSPGMTLARMPIYVWALLIFAIMVIFAFPAVIVATALLELERAFNWPFFDAARGGDPLLWQHLFWFFGHPEVYIIFLPAAGMVSMIVPTMAQKPLVGYRLVVLALIATGFLSFGLWVHHMFATGIPQLSLSYFQAASMAVAIPSGIQVFAWIATLAKGKVRLATPTLFVLGFLFIFVLGGLTGVMVAAVPFNLQVHDTYFIVAHLHYVLFGGMVFPLFAAFYYWLPYVSKHPFSERLGRWVFGLIFVGFNVAFFPMHIAGLAGMPRRVYTYPAGLGWDTLNLVSTIGAFMIGAGVLLFLFDLARKFRMASEENAGNIWNAGTLEWLPNGNYSNRSVPIVTSREPLWDQPDLAKHVEAGHYYLPGAPTGGRETIITAPLDASPQYILRVPYPGWAPVIAAWFTAAFFLLLTVKLVIPAALCGIVAVGALLHWLWFLDPAPPVERFDIGGGITLPAYMSGPASHAWWALVLLMLVSGSIYGSVVASYLYLWTVSPDVWPPVDAMPAPSLGIGSFALLTLSAFFMEVAKRRLDAQAGGSMVLALALAAVLLAAGFSMEWAAHRAVSPTESSYGAVVNLVLSVAAFFALTAIAMVLFTLARHARGKLSHVHRVVFDNTRLFWQYTVGQTLVGIVLLHAFPRLMASL